MHIFIVKGTPTERKGSEWLLQVASSSLGSGSSQQFINLGAEDLQTRWLRGEEWLPHDQNSNLGSRWLTWELYHTSLSFSVKWLSSSSPFKVVETTNWDLLPKRLLLRTYYVSALFQPLDTMMTVIMTCPHGADVLKKKMNIPCLVTKLIILL